jgi:hypothetical protein
MLINSFGRTLNSVWPARRAWAEVNRKWMSLMTAIPLLPPLLSSYLWMTFTMILYSSLHPKNFCSRKIYSNKKTVILGRFTLKMKFGKQFEFLRIEQWKDFYIQCTELISIQVFDFFFIRWLAEKCSGIQN